MKRILILVGALLLAACTAVPAMAGPNSIVFTQRNAADTGNVLRTIQQPAQDALVYFNATTNLPAYWTLGPGLVVSGGVLQASVPNGPPGPQGPVGPAGPAGPVGATGATGAPGADGAPGLPGRDGVDGAPGATGATGPVGPTGSTGAKGDKGDKGDTGAQGAQGIQGVPGPAGTPAPTFNYGLPATRTLTLSTAYQATNPAKPAIVTVSPSCSASLTLAGGTTCTLQARIGAAPLTCSSGTVVATWTNGNTGALTVGLSLNQTVGAPYGINVPTGASFILCPTAGTFTVTAAEQSAG